MADTRRERARQLAITHNDRCSEYMTRAKNIPPTAVGDRTAALEAQAERRRLERCAAMENATALGILLAMEVYADA